MKITSFPFLLKSLKPDQQCFFFYGSADTLIQLRAQFLKKIIQARHRNKIKSQDVGSLSDLKFKQTPSLFQNTQTESQSFYYYTSGALKSLDILNPLIPDLKDFILWNGGALPSKHALVQAMNSHPSIVAIPTYQTNVGEIEYYCRFVLDQENITYGTAALNKLINFHENDYEALPSNLQQLVLYNLKEKVLQVNDVTDVCLSLESDDFKECTQAYMSGNKYNFIRLFRNILATYATPLPFFRYATAFLKNSFSPQSYYNAAPALTLQQASVMINSLYQLENRIKSGEFISQTMQEHSLLASLNPHSTHSMN